MPGNAPKMIITEQDPAMTKAISEALSQTFHRYCSWHILNKFSEKLDGVKYQDYYQDFYSCIWNSNCGDEFDSRWIEIVEKSGLSDNKWLESIYEIHSSWISVHVNHCFSAGMSSSHREESQHSFYKNYVSQSNSLVEFMVQFKRGLLQQCYHELQEDHFNIEEKAKTVISLEIENHMAKVYMRKLFYEVQEQLTENFKYRLQLTRENETHCVYKVVRKNIDTCKYRVLTYENISDFVLCECRKWESEGISCRHVLLYFINIQDVDKLPTQYILKRRTKEIRKSVVLDCNGAEIKDNKDLLARRTKLLQHATYVVDKAVINDESSQLLMKFLDDFLEQFKWLNIGNVDGQSVENLEIRPTVIDHVFNEADQVRAKGSGKRLKKGK